MLDMKKQVANFQRKTRKAHITQIMVYDKQKVANIKTKRSSKYPKIFLESMNLPREKERDIE